MEVYSAWLPLPNINTRFEFKGLSESDSGFTLLLEEEESGRLLQLDLPSVVSYQVFPIEPRLVSCKSFINETFCPFYQIQNSALTKQITEVEGIDETLSHYLVCTSNTAIDIICHESPHLAWINSMFGDAI